jgi:hypothetical protein
MTWPVDHTDSNMIATEDLVRLHNSRDSLSFPHAKEIIKPWGTLEPCIAWCKSELEQDWRWQMVDMASDQRPGRYIFYFDSERDCVAFMLKWC